MPSAAAPISSLCSAMRFLSRQVSWSTGSTPAPRRRLAAASAAICARAPAPSVTLTASARPLSAARLAQEFLPVERHRRRDLRRHDEAAVGAVLAKPVLQCRGEGVAAGLVVHYLLSFAAALAFATAHPAATALIYFTAIHQFRRRFGAFLDR